MAQIDPYLQNILKAVYGEEVRGSIHDAIAEINKESTSANEAAINAKDSAAQNAKKAETSANNAKTSETNAANSAAAAANSATTATNTINAGKNYVDSVKSNVDSLKNAAAASASAAKTSETNAANSASAAAKSATAAANSATSSANSATASANSATASQNSANDSASYAKASANSASAAATSATNSASSATASAGSATNSANSATEAANSAKAAQDAANKAHDVVFDTNKSIVSSVDVDTAKNTYKGTTIKYDGTTQTLTITVTKANGTSESKDFVVDTKEYQEASYSSSGNVRGWQGGMIAHNEAKMIKALINNGPEACWSVASYTIKASDWSSGKCSLPEKTVSTGTGVDDATGIVGWDFVGVQPCGTVEQYDAWCKAKIIGSSTNEAILTALGTVPTIDIPVIYYERPRFSVDGITPE